MIRVLVHHYSDVTKSPIDVKTKSASGYNK